MKTQDTIKQKICFLQEKRGEQEIFCMAKQEDHCVDIDEKQKQ